MAVITHPALNLATPAIAALGDAHVEIGVKVLCRFVKPWKRKALFRSGHVGNGLPLRTMGGLACADRCVDGKDLAVRDMAGHARLGDILARLGHDHIDIDHVTRIGE